MRTELKNISRPFGTVFSPRTEAKALIELLFTSMLGYGKIVMLALDLILLTLCLCLSGVIIKDLDWTFSESYLSGIVYFNLLWVFLSYLRGIHKNLLLIDGVEIFITLGKVFFVFVICSWFFILILLDGFANLKVFMLFVGAFYLLFGVALISNRVILLSIRKRYKDKIRKKKNVFIIGDSSSCELLESYIEENQCDLQIKGFFNNSYAESSQIHTEEYNDKAVMMALPSKKIPENEAMRENLIQMNASVSSSKEKDSTLKLTRGMPLRGSVLDCVQYIELMAIDEIYCSLQGIEEGTARYLMKEADKHMIRIRFLPDYYQIFRRRSTIHYLGTVPIVSIREEPLTVDTNIIIKRVFDFCFSLIMVVFVLSWLVPIIGLLIKIESAGPVFFKQVRSGFNNKPFKVYKFRSMRKVKGIDEDCQAMVGDVRMTKTGAFLRRTSLDEFPQFINVLLGTMSVVGPRPHMLSHTDKFSKEVDTYMVRHFAKQGITGWAQVNGCRGETKTREDIVSRVQHDVWYIENWSLTLDLKIIFLTIWNIFKGEENAY